MINDRKYKKWREMKKWLLKQNDWYENDNIILIIINIIY